MMIRPYLRFDICLALRITRNSGRKEVLYGLQVLEDFMMVRPLPRIEVAEGFRVA